jgi:hypothetical protein
LEQAVLVLVGDPLEDQPFRRHFKDELPSATAGLKLIDLRDDAVERVAGVAERDAQRFA